MPKLKPPDKRIHNLQLAVLRHALQEESRSRQGASASLYCGNDVGKALVRRGYAIQKGFQYFLTDEGRNRATFPADYIVERDGQPLNSSLLEHWRPE